MTKTVFQSAALGAALFTLAACDVEQTKEGEAPEISVDEGSLPEYDVDAADVDIDAGTKTETVEVPTLDVDVDEADASEQ